MDVHLERIALGRLTRIRHHAWAFFCGYVVPDLLATVLLVDGFEPKEPTRVVVTRRSDSAELAVFEHAYLLAASDHRYSIDERLQTLHIYDFCRELGIDISQVGAPVD